MAERAGREVPSRKPPLVGREAAVARLRNVVDSGPGALVVGPPGVGVSALLVAVAGAQRAAGRPVHHEVAAADRGLALDIAVVTPDGAPSDDRARPLVVVDDAHRLAEADAVDLRRRLVAGQVRCVVGTTALDQGPPALDWLWQSGTLERVDLEPLSSDDLAAWVTDLVGAPPDPPTVEALRLDNGGLPGLAVDTLRALVDGRAGADAGSQGDPAPGLAVRSGYTRLTGELPCPPALRDRVARSMVGLSSDERDALIAVCVTGRLGDSSARELVPEEVRAALARRGLIRSHRGPDDVLTIVPAVGAIRRVVLAGLGPAGTADVAAGLLRSVDPARPEERGLWAALSGQPEDAAPTVGVIRHLIDQRRRDEAEVLARLALDRGDQGAGIVLAELLSERGDRPGAARLLSGLLAADELAPEVEIGATAELGAVLLWDLNDGDRALSLARRLYDKYGGAAGPASPVLLVLTAHSGRAPEAVDLLDEIEASGREHDQFTYAAGALAAALYGQSGRAIDLGERGVAYCQEARAAGGAPDPESCILALSVTLTEAGRVDEADEVAAHWYERARGHPPELAWMALARGRVALARGDLRAADAHGREAEGIFANLDLGTPFGWAVAVQAMAAALRDDGDGAAALMARVDALPATSVRFFDGDLARVRGWATHVAGDTVSARRVLVQGALDAEAMGGNTLALNLWHDAIRLGERDRAPAAVARLAPLVGGEWSAAMAMQAEAITGDDAARCLEAAERASSLGHPIEAAEAAAVAMKLAARRGDRPLVRAATAAFAAASQACPDAVTPLMRSAQHVELTGREREVAELAAQGASSRRIAEDLAISVRTVDNLLSRVYTKLGLGGRADLAAVLMSGRPKGRE